MDTAKLLMRLSAAAAPSGLEGHALLREILTGELGIAEEKIRADRNGNLLAEICPGQPGGRHIMLDAHFDEIGFIVTEIDDKGFLHVAGVGGSYPGALFGAKLRVLAAEPLFGVVVTTPPHLQQGGEEELPAVTDFCIDIGYDAEQAKQRVRLGDMVVRERAPAQLAAGRVTGKALDNRAGVAVLLETIDRLRETDGPNRVTVVFSAQEEVGTRGAATAAFALRPDEAVVVDVSFAAQPGAPKGKCGELGGGPMLGISPILSRSAFDALRRLAEAKEIPYQVEVMGGLTGTNGDPVQISGEGVPVALVSVPLRNMHTGVEIIDPEDIRQSAALIAAYLGGEEA